MKSRRYLSALLFGGALCLPGCPMFHSAENPREAALSARGPQVSSAIPGSIPLFVLDERDGKWIQGLVKEQEAALAACGEMRTCERVHYQRGLLALFESQEKATKHFQRVVTVAPQSHFAVSSSAWLRLLQDPRAIVERSSPFAQAANRLVHDLLEREQALQQMARIKEHSLTSLQELQEAVTKRDKKVRELTQKLEDLKRIDQELREKARPR